MSTSHPIGKLISGWFDHVNGVKGLFKNTLLAYRDSFQLFFCFAADLLDKNVADLLVEDLGVKTTLAFLDYLENERGNCLKTRNLRLAAIRSFFEHVAREEPQLVGLSHQVRSIPNKRTQHKTAEYLDNNEVDTLLNCVACSSPMGLRDKALLHLIDNTGARVQEIADLRIEDVRLHRIPQVKLLGKGNKQRSCPLWPESVQYLKDFLLSSCQPPLSRALFPNNRGQHITRFGIRGIVKKYAALAGQQCSGIAAKSVSPHTLRHSTAMMLVRAGNGIEMVQAWLGHADVKTTNTYFEIDMDMKRKALAKANGPGFTLSNQTKPRWTQPNVLAFLDHLTKGGSARPGPHT